MKNAPGNCALAPALSKRRRDECSRQNVSGKIALDSIACVTRKWGLTSVIESGEFESWLQKSVGEARPMPERYLAKLIKSLDRAPNFDTAIRVFTEAKIQLGLDFFHYQILVRNFHGLSFYEGTAAGEEINNVAANFAGGLRIEAVPSIRKLTRSMKPFRWTDIAKEAGQDQRPQNILRNLHDDGFIDGYSFPVSDGPGDLALISLSARGRTFDFDSITLSVLQHACLALHKRCKSFSESAADEPPELSPREQQVVERVLRGLSNKEIGRDLGISSHTVDEFLRRIFEKLGVDNRTEAAVKFALISGSLPA